MLKSKTASSKRKYYTSFNMKLLLELHFSGADSRHFHKVCEVENKSDFKTILRKIKR